MLGGLTGAPGGSWKERRTDAIIETPDKARYTFQYTDLEKDIEKKTSKYLFGDTDSQYIQDFGLGGISYPMTLHMSGANYDQDANAFEKSASKKGVCILEHPFYGVKNVIIEKINRRDNIKTEGGQVTFTLTLSETILFKIPYQEPDMGFGLLKALQDLSDSAKEAFANSFLGKTAQALVDAANRIEAIVNDVVASVEFIASTVDSVTSTIYNIQRYIDRNMSNLLQAPFTLAGSIQSLISAPSSAIASVKNKFQMYQNMYEGQKNFEGGIDSSKNSNDKKNKCAEKTLVAGAITGAICESILYAANTTENIDQATASSTTSGSTATTNTTAESTLKTKSEATALAVQIMDFYYEVQEFLDSMQENTENDSLENSFVVDSALVYNLKNVVAITVKNLVALAFSLQQERIIYTEKEYNLFELCYKLYGTTNNDTLQKLIDSNNLTGQEIIMIPQDREIRYYV